MKYQPPAGTSVTTGYVLINCELGAEEEIIEQVRAIPQVSDVFGTFGAHDIMVRVEGSHLEDLRGVIAWEIQKLAKIRSTVTLIKKDPA